MYSRMKKLYDFFLCVINNVPFKNQNKNCVLIVVNNHFNEECNLHNKNENCVLIWYFVFCEEDYLFWENLWQNNLYNLCNKDMIGKKNKKEDL